MNSGGELISVKGLSKKFGPLTAVDVRERRLGIVGVHANERAHQEGVVVLFAEQEDLRQIAIDREAVLANTAQQRRVLADAVAQESARGLRGLEEVDGIEPAVRVRAVTR